MNIGDRIKEARKNLGLSQTELAEKLHISRQLLCKYEKNIIENMPMSRMEEIATICGTTPSHLFGWDVYNEVTVKFKDKDSADRWRIIATPFSSLDEEDQQNVAKYVDFLLNNDKYKKVKNEVG